MSPVFNTPADVEDAYYDAIDECNLDKMMSVWGDAPDTACLLPMQPMHHGKDAIKKMWQPMLNPELPVDITINHIRWIEQDDIAIHLLEELVTLGGTGEHQPPIYATNIYRRTTNGWQMLMHINAPAPPPQLGQPPMEMSDI